MISIAFFNNKGGVGKTSLVYHCAWMLEELGFSVLAVDLDPQASLSAMALEDGLLEKLWLDDYHNDTLYGAVAPIFNGTGDIRWAHVEPLSERIGLLVGDLALSCTEDDLSIEWSRCFEGKERAFRVTTAFSRVIHEAATSYDADVVLIDVGPSLGAFNRAALIASSHVVVPVNSDLFSVQGLKNLGPTLRQWRNSWQEVQSKASSQLNFLPRGEMTPIGYVLMQRVNQIEYSSIFFATWQEMLSAAYRESVLGECSSDGKMSDPNMIHHIKHYRSLMPMAMEARKPMFKLTVADGAIGAHQSNVQQCYSDFTALVHAIIERAGI